jgi:hypothetical protein
MSCQDSPSCPESETAVTAVEASAPTEPTVVPVTDTKPLSLHQRIAAIKARNYQLLIEAIEAHILLVVEKYPYAEEISIVYSNLSKDLSEKADKSFIPNYMTPEIITFINDHYQQLESGISVKTSPSSSTAKDSWCLVVTIA